MDEQRRWWILRMGEVLLKSAPVRRHFIHSLQRNLRALCSVRNADISLQSRQGLLMAHSDSEHDAVEAALRRCFGLVASDPATPTRPDPQAILDLIPVSEWPPDGATFAVRTKRHGRKGEWGSQAFSAELGSLILDRRPDLKVNLSAPQWAVKVALFNDRAYLLDERIQGPGGLPAGVQGRVTAIVQSEQDLLGGWLLMRRGARLVLSPDSRPELASLLSEWDIALLDDEWGQRLPAGPGGRRSTEIWARLGGKGGAIEAVAGKTPMAHLEPLQGWSTEECEQLSLRIRQP
jgi:adenylyl- and sulfurtransferase ThiI